MYILFFYLFVHFYAFILFLIDPERCCVISLCAQASQSQWWSNTRVHPSEGIKPQHRYVFDNLLHFIFLCVFKFITIIASGKCHFIL